MKVTNKTKENKYKCKGDETFLTHAVPYLEVNESFFNDSNITSHIIWEIIRIQRLLCLAKTLSADRFKIFLEIQEINSNKNVSDPILDSALQEFTVTGYKNLEKYKTGKYHKYFFNR